MPVDRDPDDSPSTAGGASPDSEAYDAHLTRSRAVWDRWSDHYGLSERDFEPMREAAIDRLDLGSGDRVLDVGCGPGVNLERLRRDVGEDGTVTAVDYSPEMVAAARQRVTDRGWTNVDVVRADAATADLGEEYDAAVATLSTSVMPDIRGAVQNVYRSLAPGGRFVVFDLRPIPSGPARIVNPLLWRFLYWFANWNPEGDVVGSLRGIFERTEIVETYAAGAAYTALATKGSSEPP